MATKEELREQHLAAIMAAEEEVRAATAAALAAWLPIALAAVLDRTPTDQPDLNGIEITRAEWNQQAKKIATALTTVWLRRYRSVLPIDDRARSLARNYARNVLRFLESIPVEASRRLQRATQEAYRRGLDARAVAREVLNPARWAGKIEQVVGGSTAPAYNQGAQAGWTELGQREGVRIVKSWLSVRDSDVRDTHIAADANLANQSIPIDQPFRVGGFFCQTPGDPSLPVQEVVNCRCLATYRRAGVRN